MNTRIAMVTNVLDYVGPPAVKALLESGYRVVAQDPAFQDENRQKDYQTNHPGTVPVGLRDPKELIQHVWDNHKKVDVLVSNDTFPAIHIPIEDADVEDLKATIENVLIYPFRLMQEAVPRLKKTGLRKRHHDYIMSHRTSSAGRCNTRHCQGRSECLG